MKLWRFIKEWIKKTYQAYNTSKIPGYKLGVSYSVWDGYELLEAAIRSIRQEVDYVNVVYQVYSWYGQRCDDELVPTLESLREKGLIDEIICYEVDDNLEPGKNELKKRNIGLHYAIKNSCTHFMTLDVDEFFLAEEFKIAKKNVYEKNITHSAINQVEYINATTRMVGYLRFSAPFIYKIYKWSRLSSFCAFRYPAFIDPTKIMFFFPWSRFRYINEVEMHHFTTLRKDVEKKCNNSSFANNDSIKSSLYEAYKDKMSQIDALIASGNAVKCENVFRIEGFGD